MANPYTGDVDVVVEFGLSAINRFLALQHQGDGHASTWLHSVPAGIDDDNAGVHGLATIQVSTPTITLPANDSHNTVTVHFHVMARLTPNGNLPSWIHGELEATVRIHQSSSDVDDAEDILV